MQVYGLTKAQEGQILSMLAIGMIFGSPFLSFLSNNVFKARKPVLILSAGILLLLTAPLAFYTERIPIAGLYLLCFGLGVFSSAIVVIGFTTTKELFPVQMAGTATGLVNLFPLPEVLCFSLSWATSWKKAADWQEELSSWRGTKGPS